MTSTISLQYPRSFDLNCFAVEAEQTSELLYQILANVHDLQNLKTCNLFWSPMQEGHFEDVDSVQRTMEVIGEHLHVARAWRNGRPNPKEHRKKTATLCEKKNPDRIVDNANAAISQYWCGCFPNRCDCFCFWFHNPSGYCINTWKRATAVVYKEHGACAEKGMRAAFSFRTDLFWENPRADGGKTFLDGFGCSFRLCLSDRRTDGPHCGTIDVETAKTWLDWERGEFFAVAFCGDLCYCIPGWTVAVSP